MHTIITSLFLASLAVMSGCAATPDADEASEGASAATVDPRSKLATDAHVVILSENGQDRTIGAPAKIKAALKSLDGNLLALEGAPRCGPPRFWLTIRAADKKTLATVNVCGAERAFLQVGTTWYESPFAERALRKVFAEKPAVGDLVSSATDVTIGNSEGVGGRQPAAAYKKGLDLDAKPETRTAAEVPRCAPLMTLHFTEGRTDVATLAVFCPKNEDDTVAPATLTVNGQLAGWVTYDIARTLGGGF